MQQRQVDVVILGGGLAGLALARQLLLETDKRILVVDKRSQLPAPDQKVGESLVQLAGYYYSRVLELEEHLLREHFMKYNLRFYWKTAGRENRSFEDYGQAYIRPLSNVASYQIDRNVLEAELLHRNAADPRFELQAPARKLAVELAEDGGRHTVRFEGAGGPKEVSAEWVVDCSGRGRALTHKLGLARQSSIRHGARFLWVDGLVDVEKLTHLSPREVRLKRERSALGHLPMWLATNHFMEEGLWFWVIPLQGKTSLGLVFDQEVVRPEEVASADKLIDWVCRHFPLFSRDLPRRQVLHFAGYPSFSHDCAQTISAAKWAMTGEAGRFSDPFYSPGSDLIAIYNTLIVDAIRTEEAGELAAKVRIYEQVMRAVYEAYVPSYAECYNALGHQETFVLKYTWELAVYFAFYVFPFLNDLFTDRRFLLSFLKRFSQLGPVNRNLQRFLSGMARWAEEAGHQPREPVFHDFTELAPLARAAETFYRVGLSTDEAREVLADQLVNLEELARYILAYGTSRVVGDEELLTHGGFVAGIDLTDYPFDPEAMRRRWAEAGPAAASHRWSFDPYLLRPFEAAGTPAGPVSRGPARGETASLEVTR